MNLSIIIPVYNAEKYLDECLNKVLKETNDSTEIILINDGSTDGSLKICQKYKNQNIKIYNNENHGVAYSRNFGISKAKGKWIMFVDADDLLCDNWHTHIKKYYNKKFDFVFFSKNFNGVNYSKADVLSFITKYKHNKFYLPSIWSKIYSRKFLIENNIKFDEKLINGEDMIFNINCLFASSKYSFDNNSIYKYRINLQSATHVFNAKFINSDKHFHDVLKDIFNKDNTIDDLLKQKISNFLFQGARINIAYRLSLSNDYKVFYKNKDIIKLYGHKNIDYKKFNFKERVILILLNMRLYYLVFLLFNLKRKNTNIDNFYFLDI